jgi:hypothetical protein
MTDAEMKKKKEEKKVVTSTETKIEISRNGADILMGFGENGSVYVLYKEGNPNGIAGSIIK